MAWAIEENGETTSLGLEYALSTIKSPVFSNVTVIFQGDYYFCIPGTSLAFIYISANDLQAIQDHRAIIGYPSSTGRCA